jgi:hypothetical protein
LKLRGFQEWRVRDIESVHTTPQRTPTSTAAPSSEPAINMHRYPAVPLALLSTDLHISPVADLKDLISRHFPNITVLDESLSGSCGSMGTCATRIQVLERGNTHANIYASNEMKRAFWEHYRPGSPSNDRLVIDTDVIHCSHPTGMCEFYMPFNMSMIVWATTRFEQGREFDVTRLKGFFNNIRAIAAQPGNVILANSVYDQMYVYYFTGIMPEYVPSFCAYTRTLSSFVAPSPDDSTSTTVLVHGYRPSPARPGAPSLQDFLQPVQALLAVNQSIMSLRPLRDVYGHYSYEDLAKHPAILYLPYQVSVMSFFEQYRMGIPLIAPGVKLLARWQLQYGLVSERTWDMVFRHVAPSGSAVAKHPLANIPYDPNDEQTLEAIEYWLQFSDFYVFPHVLTFESWEELARIILTTDFAQQSKLIKQANKKIEADLIKQWTSIFNGVLPRAFRPTLSEVSYDREMDLIFGSGNWSNY